MHVYVHNRHGICILVKAFVPVTDQLRACACACVSRHFCHWLNAGGIWGAGAGGGMCDGKPSAACGGAHRASSRVFLALACASPSVLRGAERGENRR